MSMSGQRAEERAIGAKLVIFWLIAGIPLLWGVANTIGDATKLFK